MLLLLLLSLGTAGASAAPKPVSLQRRVLTANELSGFVPQSKPQVITDVVVWAKVAPSALSEVENRLRSAGFVAALREDLKATTADRGALSIAVQVGSAHAARAVIAQQLRDYLAEPRHFANVTVTQFAVPGIPYAHGFTAKDANTVGINIIFSDGPFCYHVGVGSGAQVSNPPTRTQVIVAATSLYRRVHARFPR